MLGGGLFDLSGQLVGIITGGIGGGREPEAGLAVPARKVRNSVEHILAWGTRQAGYVGISTADIEVTPGLEISVQSDNQLASVGPPERRTVERGAVVTDVVLHSPAWQAGLRPGDIIFSADRRPVSSGLELMDAVVTTPPNSALTLGIIRQDRPYQVRVIVGRRELKADSGLHWAGPGTLAHDADVVDSLRREITRLRETLQSLETQIDRVGRSR
jgi:S1-C subfamily serine protease